MNELDLKDFHRNDLVLPDDVEITSITRIGNTDGYDGHCLRAYAYFSDEMPDINPDSVASINSIEDKYPEQRKRSKSPTFLLTYLGTYIGMMRQFGFSEEVAKSIEANFKNLYSASFEYIKDKTDKAFKTGYVVGAFGLRIRTPMLQQFLSAEDLPYQAQAEVRTASNALGQSWCLLNNRSSSEFMQKVRKDPILKYYIRPSAQIHDAFYMMIPNNIDVVSYVNKHLVDAVNWNDHPEIYHPEVGLGGELSIFYPTWNDEIVIPNNVFGDDLIGIISKKEK